MPIKRLSVQLANQIAAGEVVERPASVVKELMENAIDAKANTITLEIRNAGKSLIKVTDNGVGIPHDELALALAPHATSKISTIEDLEAICTLGFRGEALASIASVSKLTLISRTATDPHAYQVEVVGAEHNPVVSPSVHMVGTSVIVRELFFNTPARRRFLKSDKTELNHIKDLFIRLALVNYHISFKLIVDNKAILNIPASSKENILQRIGKLLGSEFSKEGWYFDNTSLQFQNFVQNKELEFLANTIQAKFGIYSLAETNQSLSEKEELQRHKVSMFGVLLRPPTLSKSLPDKLVTFLNGRCIADRMVNHAIKEGYMSAMQARDDSFKPCIRGVIFMACDPHVVDVNVHPRKDEVRFHDSNYIHDQITFCVKSVLEFHGINKDNIAKPWLPIEGEDFIVQEQGQTPKQESLAEASRSNVNTNISSQGDLPSLQFMNASQIVPKKHANAEEIVDHNFKIDQVKVQKHSLEASPARILVKDSDSYSKALQSYLEQTKHQSSAMVSVEQNEESQSTQGKIVGRLWDNHEKSLVEQSEQDKNALDQAYSFINNFATKQNNSIVSQILHEDKEIAKEQDETLGSDLEADDELDLEEYLEQDNENTEIIELSAENVVEQGVYDGRQKEEQQHLKNPHLDNAMSEGFFASLDPAKRQQMERFATEQANLMPNLGSLEANFVRRGFEEKVHKENVLHSINTNVTENTHEDIQSEFLSLVAPDVILFRLERRFFMARGSELYYCSCDKNYARAVNLDQVETQELNITFNIIVSVELINLYKQKDVLLAAKRCGFELALKPMQKQIELVKIPKLLSGCNLVDIVVHALQIIAEYSEQINSQHQCPSILSGMMARVRPFKVENNFDGKMVIARLESVQDLKKVAHETDVKELNLFDIALSILQPK